MALSLGAAAILGGSSLLSSGLSSGLGIISANHQSGKAFNRQIAAMREQAALNYMYSQKSAENSPSWNRKGLESAGYNPMLAVQNSTSGANSSWASPQSAPQDQATDAITNGVTNGTDFANMLNNAKQTDSNVKLNQAQGRKLVSEAVNNEIHSKYLPQREEKELGMLGAQTDKLIRETSYMDQLAENMEAERRLQEMGIYVNAGNVRYQADTAYNASKYATDVKAETERGTISTHNPFGLGSTTKYYEPDDILRMTTKYGRPVRDYNDKEYWHRW